MMGAGRISAMVLCATLGLAGCYPPPLYVPPTPEPTVSTEFDGSYRGTSTLVYVAAVAQRSWCEATREIAFNIVDGTLTLSQRHPGLIDRPVIQYSARVYTDGTFRGDAERGGTISGRIENQRLRADIEGLGCSYDLVAQRL